NLKNSSLTFLSNSQFPLRPPAKNLAIRATPPPLIRRLLCAFVQLPSRPFFPPRTMGISPVLSLIRSSKRPPIGISFYPAILASKLNQLFSKEGLMPRVIGCNDRQSSFLRSFRSNPSGPPPKDWPSPAILRRWLRRPSFRSALHSIQSTLRIQESFL